MTAICRNCDKDYDPTKSKSEVPGYCTKACMHEKAKSLGFIGGKRGAGTMSEFEILKARGETGLRRKPRELGVDRVLTPLDVGSAKTYATRHALNQDERVQKVLGESRALVVYSPAAAAIAQRFSEQTLTFTLTPPDDERTLELLAEPEKVVDEAKDTLIESEADYKVADLARIRMLDEGDEIEAVRTAGTQPMNRVKSSWDGQFAPGKKARATGAEIIEGKMKGFRAKVRQEADAKLAEEQRLLDAEARRLEDEADKLAKRAGGLKNERLIEATRREEQELRAAATMLPGSLGAVQTTEPESLSNKSNRWVGSVTDTKQALETLLNVLGPEWLQMVSFGQATMNNLAKLVKDTRELPGFKFEQDEGLRRPKVR